MTYRIKFLLVALVGATALTLTSPARGGTRHTAQAIAAAVRAEKPAGGRLPAGWGKIGLSEAQRHAIYRTQAEYKAKIETAEKELAQLRDAQRAALLAHLTQAQREHLLTGIAPEPKQPEPKK